MDQRYTLQEDRFLIGVVNSLLSLVKDSQRLKTTYETKDITLN